MQTLLVLKITFIFLTILKNKNYIEVKHEYVHLRLSEVQACE